MKVAVFVKATRSSEAGVLPSERLLADMGKYNAALVNAGIMKAGEGLKPSSLGARVRFSGASRIVTDGPFTETNELVAGFWMWEVASIQEAIEWSRSARTRWTTIRTFPEQFKSEHRDIVIHVSGDTAIMHGVHHFIPTPADDPSGQTWMRVTVGYRRIEGKWKSVHDHISIPFNPMNNQAWFIRDPNTTDMPDYGAANGN